MRKWISGAFAALLLVASPVFAAEPSTNAAGPQVRQGTPVECGVPSSMPRAVTPYPLRAGVTQTELRRLLTSSRNRLLTCSQAFRWLSRRTDEERQADLPAVAEVPGGLVYLTYDRNFPALVQEIEEGSTIPAPTRLLLAGRAD